MVVGQGTLYGWVVGIVWLLRVTERECTSGLLAEPAPPSIDKIHRARFVSGHDFNTLKITDSIVQAYRQFGVRYEATYPNLGLVLDNVYQEVGGCTNPLFNNLQSQAGVIALGSQVRNTNGAAGAGSFPQFYSTGSIPYVYWIVGHSSTYGTTVPLLAGAGSTNGTGSATIYWPQMCQVGSCGTVTYDVVRTSGATSSGTVPSGTLPGGVGADGAIATLISGSCSNTVCSFSDPLSTATASYNMIDSPSSLWNDALAYWPGSFILTAQRENGGWQYVARLYTDVLAYAGTPMISSYPGSGGVPTVYAQDCSGAPIIGSPMWISCLASEPVGISRTNSGPMVLQNGNVGGTFNPTSPMGRIIFEGTGLNVQQDLITLDDSNHGVNLFSTSGFRPQANASDCAISGDGSGTNHGLAFRCTTSISNYINRLPDSSTQTNPTWLEQLTASAKSFTVPLALYNGPPNTTTNPPFTITIPAAPSAARTLNIMDPGGTASFGLSLGSVNLTLAANTQISSGQCVTKQSTITGLTSSNTLIATPQADPAVAGYKTLTAWAFPTSNTTNNVNLEICNPSANTVTTVTALSFTVKAF